MTEQSNPLTETPVGESEHEHEWEYKKVRGTIRVCSGCNEIAYGGLSAESDAPAGMANPQTAVAIAQSAINNLRELVANGHLDDGWINGQVDSAAAKLQTELENLQPVSQQPTAPAGMANSEALLDSVMAVLKATDFGATETYGSLRRKIEAALTNARHFQPAEEGE